MITTVTMATIEKIQSDLPLVLEIGKVVIFSLIMFLIVREFLLSVAKISNLRHLKSLHFLGQVINIYIVPLFFIFIYTVFYKVVEILK